MPPDVITLCGSIVFVAMYYQALQLHILYDDPITPLTLAHTRDSSDAVATSMAGAPT
jgi:hypothetical protein